MTRNIRALIGLALIVLSPVVMLLWPAAEHEERADGCMDVLGFGLDLSGMDFTNVFVAGGVAAAGLAFCVSYFFVCCKADEAAEVEGVLEGREP